jgi:ABC-type transport system involved in multi-copper enzyme maturation permease subunit
MNTGSRLRQVWTIARLQLRRVFFSRRSFWVYLLAFFPAVIFFMHGLQVKFMQTNWADQITPASVLELIHEGDTDEEFLGRAGKPLNENTYTHKHDDKETTCRYLQFFDGERRWYLQFRDGAFFSVRSRLLIDFNEDRETFAAVFHHFYLRLGIFFGCLGIFMNLFRGEMLDKTLHYWFLAPMRREVLLTGKYLAGLIAAVVIFTAGTLTCYAIMLWPQDSAVFDAFWQDHGPAHAFWYAASAAMGCIGYGSVFLAAGLLLRNPIVPAIVILLWESVNGILPAALQKLSVLYYVQSLAPVPLPIDPSAPLLIRLLLAPAEPPSVAVAVLGLLGVTVLVLWIASRTVRRLEIDYGTD